MPSESKAPTKAPEEQAEELAVGFDALAGGRESSASPTAAPTNFSCGQALLLGILREIHFEEHTDESALARLPKVRRGNLRRTRHIRLRSRGIPNAGGELCFLTWTGGGIPGQPQNSSSPTLNRGLFLRDPRVCWRRLSS